MGRLIMDSARFTPTSAGQISNGESWMWRRFFKAFSECMLMKLKGPTLKFP